MKTHISVFLCIILIFGCNGKENWQSAAFQKFAEKKIILPYSKFQKVKCSLFEDSLSYKRPIKLVHYINQGGCVGCKISQFVSIEKNSKYDDLFKQIEQIYIFECKQEETANIYHELCRLRLGGCVYFDTCQAFITLNPQIQESEIFNTLTINKNGHVMLIGNPFANIKMEKLLNKVLYCESVNDTI